MIFKLFWIMLMRWSVTLSYECVWCRIGGCEPLGDRKVRVINEDGGRMALADCNIFINCMFSEELLILTPSVSIRTFLVKPATFQISAPFPRQLFFAVLWILQTNYFIKWQVASNSSFMVLPMNFQFMFSHICEN